MITGYAKYNTTTGEILSVGTMDNSMIALQVMPSGVGLYSGTVDRLTQYINVTTKVPVTRPAYPSSFNALAFNVNTAGVQIASGMPNPSVVSIDCFRVDGVLNPDPITVTSGNFVLQSSVPGIYVVTVLAFPYQDYVASITVT